MNPIKADSVSFRSRQCDNMAILISLCSHCLPLKRTCNKQSGKHSPWMALNQNVFPLWNMDFYLSFWNKKAWAINSFGNVPSIRIIGLRRAAERRTRRRNVGETIKYFWRCLVSKHYGSTTDTEHYLNVCTLSLTNTFYVFRLSSSVFGGKHKLLNFNWVWG